MPFDIQNYSAWEEYDFVKVLEYIHFTLPDTNYLF